MFKFKDFGWRDWYRLLGGISIVIFIFFYFILPTCAHAEEQSVKTDNSPGKTVLGVTFDAKGVLSCVNDGSLRLADANILWEVTDREFLYKVIFLPPYCIDYNVKVHDSVGASKGKMQHENRPENILDLFKDALNYYFPEIPDEQLLKEFKLVSASLRPNDNDPKIVCWYFSCMRTKDLRPELLAKDGIKRHGLVFMGMAIKGDGEISSSGFQMYYSNENMIRKLVNSSSIEEVANQVIVLPPFFDNKDLGATRKGPSPFIIGGMFKRAQKVCGVSESIPLTADRFSCNKLLLEGWVLTVAPPLQ